MAKTFDREGGHLPQNLDFDEIADMTPTQHAACQLNFDYLVSPDKTDSELRQELIESVASDIDPRHPNRSQVLSDAIATVDSTIRYYEKKAVDQRRDKISDFFLRVQHVDIEEQRARELFSKGREVGDAGWKHKAWVCETEEELAEVQQAARFFYGWQEGSEKIERRGQFQPLYYYEAWYAC